MPGGYSLRAFDCLDSTNAECARLAGAGELGHIWVMAATQSAGRGRRGRAWVSRSGNLFASLLYAIDCNLAQASQLSFVAALAVRDVVADMLQSNEAVACKWPNDILVGGRKIAGILLETAGQGGASPSHVIIGIGINLIHHPDNPHFPATSLTDEGLSDSAPTDVMERLILSMCHWIAIWKDHGFTRIRSAWKEQASGLGKEIIVRLPEAELRGQFVDLDKDGALILALEGERRHITAGDVFFT